MGIRAIALLALAGCPLIEGVTPPTEDTEAPAPADGSRTAALAASLGMPGFERGIAYGLPEGDDCTADADPVTATLTIGGRAIGNVVGMVGTEGLSALYRFGVAVRAEADPAPTLGSLARLEITRGAQVATFSGVVTRWGPIASDGTATTWGLWLEPPAAVARLSANHRMFQEQTTQDVVSNVLGDAGITAFEWRHDRGLPSQACTVQVAESDLDFVQRLLEEEGIFHYSVEGPDGPRWVFADRADYAAGVEVSYTGHLDPASQAGLRSFAAFEQLRSESATVRGYDVGRPGEPPENTASLVEPGAIGERYVYEPGLPDRAEVSALAALELARSTSRARVQQGTSGHPGVRAGHTVEVRDEVGGRFSGSYAVTSARHVLLHDSEGSCLSYANAFESIPATVAFVPPRATPPPRVTSPQPALVSGPAGSNAIYADEYGRIKVHFPWDRANGRDENSSCWVRVAQPPGGLGRFVLPEIDDEVLVSFEHGDLRRPYVLGSLWNGDDLPPQER